MQTKALWRILQYGVKLCILALATDYAVMHQLKGVLAAPNPHAYCPFGGLESLYKLILSGGYIQKIMPATMILFVLTVLLAVLLNRAFCGWICPLGTLQTIFDRLARFLKIEKIQVPPAIENYLQYVKYAGLAIILLATWYAGDLVYAPYDPWAAYAHIAAGFEELFHEFLIGLIFLVAALIGSLWLPNNFCRYFCPMGALLGILAKLSPTKIQRNPATCINCKKCDHVCPAQIEISTKPRVSSMECFACGDCLAHCPVENTLVYHAQGKFPITSLVYGILTLAVFFGPVLLAEQLGWWKTNYSTATEALTDDSGAKNPANIRGSMTLEVIFKEFGIPVEALLKKFKLPENTKATEMLKDIASANQLEREKFVGEVQTFVGEYLQQSNKKPAEPAAPAPAATVKPEQTPAAEKPAAAPDIRGRTTVGELVGYGMTKERFKEITKFDLPDDQKMLLKDFATAHGLDMEVLKVELMKALQK